MRRLPHSPHEPWLAPLAGYSDPAFRLLCREYGAAVCHTEMISARGLVHKSPGTNALLRAHPLDNPLIVQLFGNEPEIVTRAMDILLTAGFRYFDLNMGCPAPKVTRGGGGAALLRDIPGALRTARAVTAMAEPGCAGFKMRLGWEARDEAWRGLAVALADAGAGRLAVHPRYARQGFSGKADWEVFDELAACVPLPLTASGDLFTAADGMRCLARHASSGRFNVMYARGALLDPAIFAEHRALAAGAPPPVRTPGDLLRLIKRHAELAREYGGRGETGALLRMRSLVPRYVRRLPGARLLRRNLCLCGEWAQFEDLVENFFASLPEAAQHVARKREALESE
jgi:tRNA-dihydrouridine synthase B